MTHARKAVLGARALALSMAVVGITVGPGGVASDTAPHERTFGEALSSGGPVLVARADVCGRDGAAWDDGSDSGDGGDGDDGGDDDDRLGDASPGGRG